MNMTINQNNLYLLLPSKVAMRLIYSSDIYKNLEKESTKMWHLGPVALYQGMIK